MQQRRLGNSEQQVSAQGLGCMGMSEFYGQADEAESLATLDRALELGVNFWDTADMYGVGRNEELIGKALHGRRDQVFLATKFAIMRGADGAWLGINGQPAYVKSACEASLRRLNIETIDLYYQHRVDPQVPIEETVGAMAELVQAGKVRFLGLSEASPEEIRRAHAVHPIAALQTEYSLWTREVETSGVLATCRELDIAFVAYSPLGRGFLTGKYKQPDDFESGDFRRVNPRFQADNLQQNLAIVTQIEAIAAEKGCTPAQLALAWVHHQGPDMLPIPGTKRRKYLEENVAAMDIVLTHDDLDRLSHAIPVGMAVGGRY